MSNHDDVNHCKPPSSSWGGVPKGRRLLETPRKTASKSSGDLESWLNPGPPSLKGLKPPGPGPRGTIFYDVTRISIVMHGVPKWRDLMCRVKPSRQVLDKMGHDGHVIPGNCVPFSAVIVNAAMPPVHNLQGNGAFVRSLFGYCQNPERDAASGRCLKRF